MRVLFHSSWLSLIWICLFASQTTARRTLSLSSLVTCMQGSQLNAEQFQVSFDPDTRALHYDLNLNSEINGTVLADVIVYAYGFQIIEQTVDLCDIGWKQFCPLYPGVIDINSVQYLSKSLADRIPGIAYTVPDIDAVARVKIRGEGNQELACIQASFGNGKTVSHVAAKWVTAVVAGLGLLVSAMLSAFGNSNSASHISANAVSLFLYFQSVVIISMCHVQEVPPIAAAWAENLSWSMGLIRVTFMQKIFRWYVQSTGGTPTLYLSSDTVPLLVQRSFNAFKRAIGMQYVEDILTKRDTPIYSLESNNRLKIFRGIERVAYKANIELTSVCCTGFTFFVLCAYVVIGVFLVFYSSLLFFVKMGWIRPNTLLEFRKNWKSIMKGVLQRYIYIGFTQLIILSFWQFIQRDSAAVIVLLCIFVVFALGIMSWSCYRTVQFGRLSMRLHQNPALILYGDSRVLNKYGWFYTMFKLQRFWWGAVLLAYTSVKLIFVAFAQSSGKTQAFALFILDLLYCCWLIYEKPYLDRPTNIINILITVVVTINSFLFTFFSNLYGQPAAVASIMGWVFFILNAAFSLILLVMILVYALIAIFSKNPDARFHPAKDDRTSFQNKHQMQFDENDKYIPQHSSDDELFALGLTAKDHNENWAGEMYKLRDNLNSDDNSSSSKTAEPLDDGVDESFGSKFVNKISKVKSNSNRGFFRRGGKQNNIATTKSIDGTSDDLTDDLNDSTVNNEAPLYNMDTLSPPVPVLKRFGSNSSSPFNHQRSDSLTPITHQQNVFSSSDDIQTISTTGISNYNLTGDQSNNTDFNFRNLSMGNNGNTSPFSDPPLTDDFVDNDGPIDGIFSTPLAKK